MRQSYLSVRENLKLPFPDTVSGGSKVQDFPTEADPYEFESAGLWALTSHLTMCRTARGYVGLVPKNTVKGDWIYVLYGCPVPFVLRKSTLRDGGIFQLVQKAYVHGIMTGEALRDELFNKQDIRLH
jgi:hypothetical protein